MMGEIEGKERSARQPEHRVEGKHSRETTGKILFFCYGDSRDASTWSNVPYLMSKELESAGFSLIRVDLSHSSILARVMNKLYRLLKAGENYDFTRSSIFRRITERKIRQAVNQHPDAEMAIFLMFDFITPAKTIPCLVFSDWTFKMLIEDRNHRKPTRLEQQFIAHQKYVIENADIVLPLFSETYKKLHSEHPNANIQRIKGNVVNIMYDGHIDAQSLVREKFRSKSILFIGKPAYREGLQKLISSIGENDGITVEIVGMTANDMPGAPSFCRFHGFLRKDVAEERDLYYRLLSSAKIICNPTSVWAAYSSIVEGMYFYTPVIVTPFSQFVDEFGKEIKFGFYTDGHDLKTKIEAINNLSENEYAAMAYAAHDTVSDYTWKNYVGRMIEIMDNYKTSHQLS